MVALTDWVLFGTPLSAAAIFGGLLIIGAFLLLSWATYSEMVEEKAKRIANDISDEEDDEDDEDIENGNSYILTGDDDDDLDEDEEGDIGQNRPIDRL